jgi:hypothetical protein
VSIAIYDAVVAIEGGYEPYSTLPRPHANASPEVAAATAAYRVLSSVEGRPSIPSSSNAASSQTPVDIGAAV